MPQNDSESGYLQLSMFVKIMKIHISDLFQSMKDAPLLCFAKPETSSACKINQFNNFILHAITLTMSMCTMLALLMSMQV